MSFEDRRTWTALHWRIDPATHTAADTVTAETRFYSDVDGLPLRIERVPVIGAYVNLAMPRTYWDMAFERPSSLT